MKKIWLAAGFVALAGALSGVLPSRAVLADPDDWVEKGSFAVEVEDGYPKNVQGKGEESKVTCSFVVYTPFLYNAKEDKQEQLYSVNKACIVLAGNDGYATATGGEQLYMEQSSVNKSIVYATYGRLKSGLFHLNGCFVELAPTSYGEALGYKKCWDVCQDSGAVTTNGTDVNGRGYFKSTGQMNYHPTAPVGFEGLGVCRIKGTIGTVQAVNNGFNYEYGTCNGAVVVHSPLNSAVRVDWTDWMATDDLTWDTALWDQRVYVRDCDDDSKASSLVVRTYMTFAPPNPGDANYQEGFCMPTPGIALKTAVNALTINVPENQR